jgi:addiction module HigA family antidote
MLKKQMPVSHPGRILKNMYMEPLGLTAGAVAENLGVSRKTLSLLMNEHQGISAEMALRLAKAFNTTPALWMNLQQHYDLWKAAPKVSLSKIKVFHNAKTLSPEAAAFEGKNV